MISNCISHFRFVLETFPQGAEAPEAAGGSAGDGDQEDPGPGGCAEVTQLRHPGPGQGDHRQGGRHQGDQEDWGLWDPQGGRRQRGCGVRHGDGSEVIRMYHQGSL